jgi:hypothetical protein
VIYARTISVIQIRKGESFATLSKRSPVDLEIPDGLGFIVDRLPTIPYPSPFPGVGLGGIDLGDAITGGNINVAIETKDVAIYGYDMIEAYPVNVSPITYTDEADGIGELNVEFAYYYAKPNETIVKEPRVEDAVNDLLKKVREKLFNRN